MQTHERPRIERRRDELVRHIAHSKRVRRGAVRVGVAGLALAFVLLAVGVGTAIFIALALLAVVIAGTGLWITWGHIEEFEKELASIAARSDRL